MNKTLLKDTLRLITHSKSRYLSLILIVMIGTAFYSGLTASSTMMAANVDQYNDSLNLKDITVYSNYGFDEDDLKVIEQLDEVVAVEGGKFVDVVASSQARSTITRIHSFDEDASINQFVLVEGRLPQSENEVLAEAGSDLAPGFSLGSTLTLTRPKNDLEDFISVDEVIVVGTIDTPLYLNETKENSTLGNQYIQTYLYLPTESFVIDYDLEVNVITEHGKDYNSFYEAYFEYIDPIREEIELVASSNENNRRNKIVDEAWDEYNKGYQEYLDGLDTFNTEIEEAEQELSDAQLQLEDGQRQLLEADQALRDAQEELNRQKAENQKTIDEGWDQYYAGLEEYNKGLQEFLKQESQLQETLKQIDEGIAQIDEGIEQLQQAKEGLETIDQTLEMLSGVSQFLHEMQSVLQQVYDQYPQLHDLSMHDVKDTLIMILEEQVKTADETRKQILEEILARLKQEGDFFENLLTELKENREALIERFPELEQYQIELDYVIQLLESMELRETTTFTEFLDKMQELITSIDELQDTLIETRQEIIDQLIEQGIDPDHIDEAIADLQKQRQELEDAKKQIQDGLEEGKKQLDDAYALLMESRQKLIDGQNELDEGIQEGQRQIDANRLIVQQKWKELNDGLQELIEGREEFERQKADGLQELNDAKAELDKAKQDIEALEAGEWTVLDRNKHYASATFKSTVEQMKSIADIFPLFFLAVAALVCLTTMSRMIDEERGQIGLMRALGYSEFQCAFRYLFYAFSATIIGCTIGAFIGMLTFPFIIYTAWEMMYILPKMQIFVNWKIIGYSFVAFLAVTLGTTWYTVSQDMKEVPSQLLRPKTPKLGKSTILERLTFFYSRLSFTWKVTIRNLLRYKKRMIMTVLGVSGCTALLITGFGVKDSISTMVDLQFSEILHYDGSAILKEDVTLSQASAYADELTKRSDVEQTVLIGGYSGIIEQDDMEETANVLVMDQDEVTQLFTLRTRKKHEPIELNDDGVILSEKLSENLDLKVGDYVSLESKTGLVKQVRISAITELYIQHYILMSDQYYQSVFGTTCPQNQIVITESEDADGAKLQSELVDHSYVDSINFFDEVLENFTTMVKSLDLIVWVIIFSSMSLAFVVLGNLMNINISERQREIATLMVLGFHDQEVETYIYKENNLLTLFGALVGIPIGNQLHHWIMRQVEMDYVMFGRSIQISSFLISIVLTVIFGRLVNLMMKKKLHGIAMVESLKSVE